MAAAPFQSVDDLLLERGDAFVSSLVESEVDLAPGTNRADESIEPLPRVDGHFERVAIKEAKMGIFDKSGIAERCFARDQELDTVPGGVEWWLAADVPLEAHARDDAFASRIDVNGNDHIVSGSKRAHLF